MNNKSVNLYWPVYRNLERELQELSHQVHFDDQQLSIYSIKLAELLIRCAVEIEAISKELYFLNGGSVPTKDRDLFFDTDCLQRLEDMWQISQKTVIVSAANFYFEDVENLVLTPLRKANKRGSSSADWIKAYQAVKHNRVKNISKANVKNVLRALAALFVLNIYFRNEVFLSAPNENEVNFPVDLGSEIFAIKVHRMTEYSNIDGYLKRDDFAECIYVTKFTDKALEDMQNRDENHNARLSDAFTSHPKFQDYISKNRISDYKGNNLMLDILGEEEYVKTNARVYQVLATETIEYEYEAVVNKHQI